jgi:hypothetical protein
MEKLSVKQLRVLAKTSGLSNYSRLKKAGLVNLIAEFRKQPQKKINKREIKVRDNERISVGHAIINIYTGGSSHPDYPIPQSVVKSALNANSLKPQHQREVFDIAGNIPVAPPIKKEVFPLTKKAKAKDKKNWDFLEKAISKRQAKTDVKSTLDGENPIWI